MKAKHQFHRNTDRGFALVVTLSMMILLTVIAVGLLSLSSISLRKGSSENAYHVARANARLALMLALGELQKAAGPDQRITADRSILISAPANPDDDDTPNKNVVGVWKSWSPRIGEGSAVPAGNNSYASQKVVSTAETTPTKFFGWLTSTAAPKDLMATTWADNASLDQSIDLFTMESDGFSQAGSKLPISPGSKNEGAIAWTIVQEGTKAKINVGGPEDNKRLINDSIQAQARPNLDGSKIFKQPRSGWDLRSGKVLTISQAKLDNELWGGGSDSPSLANKDFTTSSMGLLTDCVYGGLKTDLSLGFEIADETTFRATKWGDYTNPFFGGGNRKINPPSGYSSQRPLFKTLSNSGSVEVKLNFEAASTLFQFPAATVPTFSTLRSFYRTPYHMYLTDNVPTVFERGMDHVALYKGALPAAPYFPPPNAAPPAQVTQTGYRPVLDRIIFFLSIAKGADDRVRLVFTPIVTLWNPYNVALEIEGAVAYPWLDVPFRADWRFYKNGTTFEDPDSFNPKMKSRSHGLSGIMGGQFINSSPSHGRSVNPYFFASILPTSGQTIRFKPGEVRVFAPTGTTDIEYQSNGTIAQRTIKLGPVTNPNQVSTKVGVSVPFINAARPGNGFDDRKVMPTDSVEMDFVTITNSSGKNYPFAIGLEDATRAKTAPAQLNDRVRGQTIGDIQTVNFSLDSKPVTLKSPRVSYATLGMPASRVPFGMIETYHRTAKTTTTTPVSSDLVFTTNPRQPYVNAYLSAGTFLAGPHYETRVRTGGLEVINLDNNGRNAFYGASQSNSGGLTELSFFEAPQQPILSIAALQHADISGTAFSTANQIGNSWASAYVRKTVASESPTIKNDTGLADATYARAAMPSYDYSYLANEALWDSYFFSSIAPGVTLTGGSGSPSVWNPNQRSVSKPMDNVLGDFLKDPENNPLRNSRMKFYAGDKSMQDPNALNDLKTELLKPEGCLKVAANLMVDGAFNVNSTNRNAWIAYLSGLRDAQFTVESADKVNGSLPGSGKTAFPRFRNPFGNDTNLWMGFRSLSEADITLLADNIIAQVRLRGPFLSLGEFVNRRVENNTSAATISLKGAVQNAIDDAALNTKALGTTKSSESGELFKTDLYPSATRTNISPANTGVGIPGYLTQADVLTPLAPTMTVRSDTFTIRAYGEVKDVSGKIIASARCEAVVQRMPEYCDPTDKPDTVIIPTDTVVNNTNLTPSNLTQTNIAFGRRFAIVSFRYLSDNEVVGGTTES